MRLTDRLADRGLGPDYTPLRGAEALLDAGMDDAHLLAEHEAACETLRQYRTALSGLAHAIRSGPCLAEMVDDEPCACCVTACDVVRVWTDGLDLRSDAT